MNTDAIFQKYWKTLLDLGIASEVDSAIALALRLAIQEAVDANAALVNDMSAIIANLRSQELVPESALVAAQNEVSMLRQQRGTLIEEAEQLRQQLAQLDADNADLTKKLAAFNQTASIQDVPVMHVNGNGTAPAPFDWWQHFQIAFDNHAPAWMPNATSICTAFACKWEDLPALKREQVKL